MTKPWAGSTRKQRLPPGWERLRLQILARDGRRCTHTDQHGRCTAPATDVHHVGSGDDHRPQNLASLCAWHHRRETAAEGNAARWRVTEKRPAERHPGLIG